MRLLCLFLLGLQLIIATELPEFTTDEFDVQIKQKQFMLVMFYAPWCGHCKRLKPGFISVGKKLMDHEAVGFAFVDCTTQDKLCSRFGVTGYPTLKFFKDGEFFLDYSGPRNEDGLMKFAIRHSLPPSKELQDKDELNKLLRVDPFTVLPLVVSFIKSKTDEFMDVHNTLAGSMLDEAVFAHTHNPAVFENTVTENTVRLYRPEVLVNKLTEPYIDFKDELKADTIRPWVLRNGHGLVGYRSAATAKFFPRDNIFILFSNVTIDSYPKGVNYYRNRLAQLVKESGINPNKLTFVYCYYVDFPEEFDSLGITSDPSYPVVLLKYAGKKYKLEEYSRDNVLQFLKSFEDGTLQPFIKSEPIPTEQSSAAVYVVGHTFDKIVNDPTRDVFVMFHAPWCGHCKALKPKYENVAKKLKNEPGVLMVTYDATANDIPDNYKVHGYPTLYFVPKNSKHSPKPYTGDREEDDLLKFIARESTDELQGYDRSGNVKKVDL